MEIDWSGIRAAAVTVGVREAARRAGADLPEAERESFVERVMKRCQRQGWLVHAKAAALQPVTTRNGQLSANVRTGAQAASDSLADDNKATRHALSKALRKGAEHAADMQPGAILKQSRAVVDMAKGAGLVHEWNGSKPDGGLVNVTLVRLELPAMPDLKDAKVIELESGE